MIGIVVLAALTDSDSEDAAGCVGSDVNGIAAQDIAIDLIAQFCRKLEEWRRGTVGRSATLLSAGEAPPWRHIAWWWCLHAPIPRTDPSYVE